jgi:hypothetical protein
MRRLDRHASDAEILSVIREWAALLAAADYAAALELVAARSHWTPDLLRRVVSNYGSLEPRADGAIFRVTPLSQASGGPAPRHTVEWAGDRGWAQFDLPLNGEWSDLTATFDLERGEDRMVVVLDDVHVL